MIENRIWMYPTCCIRFGFCWRTQNKNGKVLRKIQLIFSSKVFWKRIKVKESRVCIKRMPYIYKVEWNSFKKRVTQKKLHLNLLTKQAKQIRSVKIELPLRLLYRISTKLITQFDILLYWHYESNGRFSILYKAPSKWKEKGLALNAINM
jgi:hypothetical protein